MFLSVFFCYVTKTTMAESDPGLERNKRLLVWPQWSG